MTIRLGPRWYTLDGHTPVPTTDLVEAMQNRPHVALTEKGKVSVSTVFLGIDHSFFEGPPLVFETMIFGGEHDGWQDRCSTWEEAEAMHARACALLA